MPYVITLTDLRVENVRIYKEFDDEGNFSGLGMSLNGTLFNTEEDQEGKNFKFDLTEQQEAQIRNFMKPFVQEAATFWDVNPPAWAV